MGADVKVSGEQAALDLLTKGWDGFLSGPGRELFETALPDWLVRQRWFGAKSRTVAQVQITQWVTCPSLGFGIILPSALLPAASSLGEVILLLELAYTDGSHEQYQLPIAYASGAELDAIKQSAAGSIVMEVHSPTGPAAFHDAVVLEEFRQALLGLVEHTGGFSVATGASAAAHIAATLVAAHESRPVHEVSAVEIRAIAAAIQARHSIETEAVAPGFVGHMPGAAPAETPSTAESPHGTHELRGVPSIAFATVRGEGSLAGRIGSAEQSNTNILYGQRVILKLFRRLQPGLNPDIEIGRFLTDVAHFDRIPPFLGEIALHGPHGNQTSLAMVQGLVANEGDGWQWTLTELASFFRAATELQAPAEVGTLASTYLVDAALLGRRTAEMHRALATPTDDPAFAAEPYTEQDIELDALRLEAQIKATLDALELGKDKLQGEGATRAELVLARRADVLEKARAVSSATPSGKRIRIHGDYHLGQILRAQDDFVLLDFEGEPARSLDERRRKQSPLRDVAGMLRSFSYAAASALDACAPELRTPLAPWARAWETAVSDSFLKSYWAATRVCRTLLPETTATQAMLQGYVLEKALYELLYELNNRPAWVGIPLAGILNFSEASGTQLS